ncbi:MAG: hypothetical protein IPN94_18305 [Sphingobacteriales bacterium]|nr:hypothetical protein [Sphingobacteriales bacterium]
MPYKYCLGDTSIAATSITTSPHHNFTTSPHHNSPHHHFTLFTTSLIIFKS